MPWKNENKLNLKAVTHEKAYDQAELNEVETKITKFNEMKSWFVEKIIKIATLSKINQKKEKRHRLIILEMKSENLKQT